MRPAAVRTVLLRLSLTFVSIQAYTNTRIEDPYKMNDSCNANNIALY